MSHFGRMIVAKSSHSLLSGMAMLHRMEINMKTLAQISFAAVSALALAACGSAGGDQAGNSSGGLSAVGSSTVYPFAKVVTENFVRSFPEFPAPLLESTGTGGGIQLFCGGAGLDTPSIANASRRIKASELETCTANGVDDVTEIQVGLDGIAFASAKGGINMPLTPELVYRAIAAKPYGKEQTAKNWSDLDPSLPSTPILVYGPPSTSGTRDALKELVLEVGCEAQALPEGLSEDETDAICTEVRADSVFVETGEQDNLIVQKIEGNSNAVGVFGFSYLEENLDRIQGLSMNGVAPTFENISSFEYLGARPLFIYVKKAHLEAVPGLKEYVNLWSESWGKDGPLAKVGLVPNDEAAMTRSTKAASEYPSLTAADLK